MTLSYTDLFANFRSKEKLSNTDEKKFMDEVFLIWAIAMKKAVLNC
jgi:hypothetical protein